MQDAANSRLKKTKLLARRNLTEGNLSRERKYRPRKNTKRGQHEKSKKNEIKEANDAGLPHKTAKGKEKPARQMGAGCSESCRRCANPRLSEEERKKIFQDFWKLQGNTSKWDYISRRVFASDPMTINTLPETARSSIKTYTFKVGDESRRLCKTMFLQTLSINFSWVETALKKVNEKGSITQDKRGGHQNRPNRASDATRQSCRDHINMIQRLPSHYGRRDSRQEYFEEGLSFERLYKMYVEHAKAQNLEVIATKSCYREVFVIEFNIGFHKPLTDQCLVHAQWLNASEEGKLDMKDKYDDDHLSKEKLRCEEVKTNNKPSARQKVTKPVTLHALTLKKC